MGQPPSAAESTAGETTRRDVLTRTVAAVSGIAVASAAATGQTTTSGVIPTPDRWENANLAGFMVHVGPTLDPESVEPPSDCDFDDWPPDETERYDVALINRKDADTPEEQTRLFVDASVDVNPGELFIVNTFGDCEDRHTRVELEWIGRRFEGTATGPHVDVEDDERPGTGTDDSGATGPGLGALEAVAAATGLGGLGLWRRRDG